VAADAFAAGRPAEPSASGTDNSALLRQTILDTIKRGIKNNEEKRADLGDGEQRMLEQMKVYLKETKSADTRLSDAELAIWESMKTDYLKKTEKNPVVVRGRQGESGGFAP